MRLRTVDRVAVTHEAGRPFFCLKRSTGWLWNESVNYLLETVNPEYWWK
ncbi:MAG: hypothetical protein U5K84_06905 [Alkalibacterium sp.]|nr:hypothetical protein [Alkalibacterium sp.]